jgi:hypothetical protein
MIVPTSDLWILACLNSPANWYYTFRHLPHKKDEAVAMDIVYIDQLPIAPPTETIRLDAEPAIRRLIALTNDRRAALHETLDWLRVEFEIETPG